MFSYVHIDDPTRIARKAVEADYDGHESLWAVAGDTTAAVPTEDVVSEFFSDAERRQTFEGHETLFDISKAERLLDWTPERSRRDYWRRRREVPHLVAGSLRIRFARRRVA
jgi:nucleoside-diphosphate-sugar epimerase